MRVEQAERVMATTASVGGVDIAAVRSTAHLPCDPADLPDLTPMWRLKVIPRADGNGLDVLQLVSGGRQAADTVVHVSRAGDGVVEFRPSPVFDVMGLEPREFTGAFYAESDFTEDFGVIDRDFLKEPGRGRREIRLRRQSLTPSEAHLLVIPSRTLSVIPSRRRGI